jgi:hypothetical protein
MRVYSFQNIVMIINGVEITGWAEGDDVISVKRRNDSASDKVGAAGEMMVSLSADKSGEIGFKLQQTSASNRFLNNLVQLQEAGSNLFVPVTVTVQDTFRRDSASGTVGYLKKPADFQRGAQGSNQEWTIVVERLDLVFGDAVDAVV